MAARVCLDRVAVGIQIGTVRIAATSRPQSTVSHGRKSTCAGREESGVGGSARLSPDHLVDAVHLSWCHVHREIDFFVFVLVCLWARLYYDVDGKSGAPGVI